MPMYMSRKLFIPGRYEWIRVNIGGRESLWTLYDTGGVKC